jgi:hypothetical protein
MICTKSIGISGSLGANTAGATAYSDIVAMNHYVGYDCNLGLLVTTTTAYTSSAITITQQCSIDQANWYNPVDVYNVSTDAIYSQAAAGTAQSRFIKISPTITPFLRFKVVSGSEATVAMTLVYQEEI